MAEAEFFCLFVDKNFDLRKLSSSALRVWAWYMRMISVRNPVGWKQLRRRAVWLSLVWALMRPRGQNAQQPAAGRAGAGAAC